MSLPMFYAKWLALVPRAALYFCFEHWQTLYCVLVPIIGKFIACGVFNEIILNLNGGNMAKVFYLSELIKFAIEKEKQSEMFYQDLASNTNNVEAKKLFETLFKEEKKHEEFYRQMLSHISEEQTPGVSEDDEYLAYMRELISSSRSVKPYSVADMSNVDNALSYGIEREKDSVLFYVGLKSLVPAQSQHYVEMMIQEEAKHMALLFKLKNQL
jgi:rubrerythrin